MGRIDSVTDWARVFARVAADALTYALAVTVAAGIAALALGVATGGGLVSAKHLLFLGGWLLLAYATIRLWPTSPDDAGPNARTDDSLPGTHESTRFQRLVVRLPPRRWVRTPRPRRRLTIPGKLLLSALLILLLSLAMETVFGVA